MICVDCRSVWSGPSGVAGYQKALARKLPSVAPGEHFQLLLTPESETCADCQPNAHAVYVPANRAGRWGPLSLGRGLDPRGVSLVHATDGVFPDVHVPVVTNINDARWITQPETLRPPGLTGAIAGRIYRRLLLRALDLSTRIIVPSEATRRAIVELAPSAADRISVVLQGVGESFVALDPADAGAPRRVSETKKRFAAGAHRFVLEVGRPFEHRNHEGLLRAFAAAFRGDNSMHLVFVQSIGSRTQALIKLAHELGIESRVHVVTGVSDGELCALYQGAVCLCHPTTHESYPTPIVEAMACGCPVITSGRAAAGEIAEGAAQLVNPEHDEEIEAALRRVTHEPGVGERLRTRGLARARNFSAADTARGTWKVYQQALAS